MKMQLNKMAPSFQQPLNGQGCKESQGINSKTRARFRLELDLKPGTLVVFVVEGQRWQRN